MWKLEGLNCGAALRSSLMWIERSAAFKKYTIVPWMNVPLKRNWKTTVTSTWPTAKLRFLSLAAAAVSFNSRLFFYPGNLSCVRLDFMVMIDFKGYIYIYIMATHLFTLFPAKLFHCLSPKFKTCIILVMCQKGSISDSPTVSHMLMIAVIKIISRLTWVKGINFNCMQTKLFFFLHLFPPMVHLSAKTHWHRSHKTEIQGSWMSSIFSPCLVQASYLPTWSHKNEHVTPLPYWVSSEPEWVLLYFTL